MENSDKYSRPSKGQVFELTMDNTEDQDELDRLLRKPGEPGYRASTKPVEPANAPPSGTQRISGSEPRP